MKHLPQKEPQDKAGDKTANPAIKEMGGLMTIVNLNECRGIRERVAGPRVRTAEIPAIVHHDFALGQNGDRACTTLRSVAWIGVWLSGLYAVAPKKVRRRVRHCLASSVRLPCASRTSSPFLEFVAMQ